MRGRLRFALFALALAGVVMLPAGPASAHEERTIGRYHFAVGWGDEPAYAGFKNSVQLLLSSGEKPVNNLGDTLKVEVSFGTQTTSLAFEPNFEVGEFGIEGDYRAWLIPTRSGTYAFHFTGTIGRDRVDATFTCGEQTFDCVKDSSEAQFPAKDPSTAQLLERINRNSLRTADLIAAAKDRADRALLLGIAGVAIGALALTGALAGRRGRKAKG